MATPEEKDVETPTLRSQLQIFLAWCKPYREIIVILGVVVGAVAAALAWVVAYFATQAAVSLLECKLTYQGTAHHHDARAGAYQAQVDSRQSQVSHLSAQTPPVSVTKLMEEVAQLTTKASAERDLSSAAMMKAADCAKK